MTPLAGNLLFLAVIMLSFATQVGILCLVLFGVQAVAGYNITDDTVFYGQSPPVCPSRTHLLVIL